MCNSPPKKNSSILHKSQDLSVFAKKMKSVKNWKLSPMHVHLGH